MDEGLEGLFAHWDNFLQKSGVQIAIGMPCFRGAVNIFCLSGLLEAKMPPSYFFTTVGSLAYIAREKVLSEAMKKQEWQYLFWLDDDIRIPFFAIMRLVQRAEKYPFQTTLVPFRKLPISWSIYDMELDEKNERKLCEIADVKNPTFILPQYRDRMIPVRAGGLACALTSRKLFETHEGPFFQPWDPRRKEVVGEDIFFFEKMVAEGEQPYCDTSIISEHFEGIVSYPGVIFKTGRFRCSL